MTEQVIKQRLARVIAAFGDKSRFRPEEIAPTIEVSESGFSYVQDFTGGRSQENLDADAAAIINEIMGLRDRTKAWLKNTHGDVSKVDKFIKSEPATALVHDLANTDKHAQLDGPPFSGHKPRLSKVNRVVTLIYDPSTGTYEQKGFFIGHGFNLKTGELVSPPASVGTEIVLDSEILDEDGNKIGELKKLLPDAIYKWEQFLCSIGLALQ